MEPMPSFDWISLFLAANTGMGSLVCMLILLHFNNFKPAQIGIVQNGIAGSGLHPGVMIVLCVKDR
jgi:hypothetical protein